MRKIQVIKLLICSLILVVLYLGFASLTFAGQWWPITSNPADSPIATGKWFQGNVPHLGLQTSTDQCKVCHAVHDGSSTGFRLLHDSSRATECNYCHGEQGAISDPQFKPYAAMLDGNGNEITPKGMHLIGYTDIPEASQAVKDANSIKTDGLSCGNCHSVHDAWTINSPLAGDLSSKLLKRDPANNGGDVLTGITNVESYDAQHPAALGTTGSINADEIQAAFCGDCHNKNPNWDRGGNERPNSYGHPIGSVDGYVDVYGANKLVVTADQGNPAVADAGALAKACSSCHKSKTDGAPSKFPHQSVGHKLLGNAYTATSSYLDQNGYTGDPFRPIPNLDGGVCRTCHSEIGQPNSIDSF